MKTILIFGAGKIGRSFIGQLFSRAGWKSVFVDIDHEMVRLLNKRGRYRVIIKDKKPETLWVENVRAIHGTETDKIADEIARADMMAVSVGKKGLGHIIPVIAQGLKQRYEKQPGKALDILIAENMRDADSYIREELRKHMPKSYPLGPLVGLVETSIGKMVPIMTAADLAKDPLQLFAEAYNNLPLDGKAFRNAVPDAPGLAPKANMKAWVDRKLFVHNLGHATAAYIGHLKNPAATYIYEVLEDKEVHAQTRSSMQESAAALKALYPGEFTDKQLAEHIDDLLSRFANRALGDTLFRVGCDLPRKLGPQDRMVAPLKTALEHSLPYSNMLNALVAGMHFRARDEKGKPHPADKAFHDSYDGRPQAICTGCCGLDHAKDRAIIAKVVEIYGHIKAMIT